MSTTTSCPQCRVLLKRCDFQFCPDCGAKLDVSSPPDASVSFFFGRVKAAIAHVENTERELVAQKFRNTQLETVLKILARRNGSKLLWTKTELKSAAEDERCIMLGALDMDLYGGAGNEQSPSVGANEKAND